jgi:hypothetical protein
VTATVDEVHSEAGGPEAVVVGRDSRVARRMTAAKIGRRSRTRPPARGAFVTLL